MRLAKRLMLAAALLGVPCAALLAQAGTGRVTGTVTDSANGQPIPGVNILVVGTRFGAATGPDGRYTIAGQMRDASSDVLDALQPGDTILSATAE